MRMFHSQPSSKPKARRDVSLSRAYRPGPHDYHTRPSHVLPEVGYEIDRFHEPSAGEPHQSIPVEGALKPEV
jgi:hypothetical protein